MYDPASGRFTTKDSRQSDYKRPLSLNAWMYTEGNPVNYADPTGHCSGDPSDPKNPDISCWNMITHIESRFTNVHVFSRDKWIYNELLAMAKALSGRGFGGAIATAPAINFYRQEFGGSGEGGLTKQLDDGTYNIAIYNLAYYIEPDVTNASGLPNLQNFEGAIVHELTHVAIDQDPTILQSYKQEQDKHGSGATIGLDYNKSNCVTAIPYDADCMNKEMIAMTASTFQLSPKSFDFSFFLGHDWRKDWFQSNSSLNPLAGMCYGPYK